MDETSVYSNTNIFAFHSPTNALLHSMPKSHKPFGWLLIADN